MYRVTVYLPEGLKRELDRVAAETGRSEAELIREGICQAIARHLPPPPRSGIFESGEPCLSERVDEPMKGFGER